MKAITEAQARHAKGADLLELAEDSPVVIKRKGKANWALVPLLGQDWESFVVSRSPVFRRIISRSRRRYKREGGISLAQVKKE